MSDKRETILNTVDDLVSKFLYYDRKEDEDLPRGAIEAAILDGEISVEDMSDLFKAKLIEGLAP